MWMEWTNSVPPQYSPTPAAACRSIGTPPGAFHPNANQHPMGPPPFLQPRFAFPPSQVGHKDAFAGQYVLRIYGSPAPSQ